MKTGNLNITQAAKGMIRVSIENQEVNSDKSDETYVANFDATEREVIDRVVEVMEGEPLPKKLEANKTYRRNTKNFMPELIMQMSRRRPGRYYR